MCNRLVLGSLCNVFALVFHIFRSQMVSQANPHNEQDEADCAIVVQPEVTPAWELNSCSLLQLVNNTALKHHMAKRILSSRPFKSMNDLSQVRGFGPSKIDMLRRQGCYVDASKATKIPLAKSNSCPRPSKRKLAPSTESDSVTSDSGEEESAIQAKVQRTRSPPQRLGGNIVRTSHQRTAPRDRLAAKKSKSVSLVLQKKKGKPATSAAVPPELMAHRAAMRVGPRPGCIDLSDLANRATRSECLPHSPPPSSSLRGAHRYCRPLCHR